MASKAASGSNQAMWNAALERKAGQGHERDVGAGCGLNSIGCKCCIVALARLPSLENSEHRRRDECSNGDPYLGSARFWLQVKNERPKRNQPNHKSENEGQHCSRTEILHVRDSGGMPCKRVRELAHQKLSQLDEQIAHLSKLRISLRTTVREWDLRLKKTSASVRANLLKN